MKMVKTVIEALFGLALLLIVVSFFLPSEWRVERSTTIEASVEEIFPYLNNLKNWADWIPWDDPTMVRTYEGPEEGVGAISQWRSERWNAGLVEIEKSIPDHFVGYSVTMGGGEFYLECSFELSPSGAYAEVSWSCWGEVGRHPIGKLLALGFDSMMGSDLEAGLANLKALVEATPL